MRVCPKSYEENEGEGIVAWPSPWGVTLSLSLCGECTHTIANKPTKREKLTGNGVRVGALRSKGRLLWTDLGRDCRCVVITCGLWRSQVSAQNPLQDVSRAVAPNRRREQTC